MKLLFISYWGVDEGLTSATVLPHLKILSSFNSIETIVFCSIERHSSDIKKIGIDKVEYVPLYSQPSNSVLLTKFFDFTSFSKRIIEICNEYSIDLIFCRSAMAGAIGYLVHKKTKIPFVVESFEPHADSMRESGVWKLYDPRFWIQKHFEFRQKKTANAILPVSSSYFQKLINEGVEKNRIKMMPCCVDVDRFRLNPQVRRSKREELKIEPDEIVGIYVGKFGGIYYDEESFVLFKEAFDFFGPTFKLIILSADGHELIKSKLSKHKISLRHVILHKAKHECVPDYLATADFAFSTIKPVASRLYCSPIKNGEYWANGLPILTELGIGDDSEIILNEGGGVILDMGNREKSFLTLKKLLGQGRLNLAETISKLAYKYRRMELVENTYKELISESMSGY